MLVSDVYVGNPFVKSAIRCSGQMVKFPVTLCTCYLVFIIHYLVLFLLAQFIYHDIYNTNIPLGRPKGPVFCVTFYDVNQIHLSPRINLHYEAKGMFLLGVIQQISPHIPCILTRWHSQSIRTCTQSCWQENFFSQQKKHEHLFVCKHKNMMKNGAPLDKFRVLYRLLSLELQGFL